MRPAVAVSAPTLTAPTDWDRVTVLRKHVKPADARSASAVNNAMRSGQAVDTSKKCPLRNHCNKNEMMAVVLTRTLSYSRRRR